MLRVNGYGVVVDLRAGINISKAVRGNNVSTKLRDW